VGQAIGAEIEYTTIGVDFNEAVGWMFGHTKFMDLNLRPVEHFVLVALAGSLAEQRELGDVDPWVQAHERHRAEILVAQATERGMRRGPASVTAKEENDVIALIDAHWPAVIAVAAALIATPTLSGDTTYELIERAIADAE